MLQKSTYELKFYFLNTEQNTAVEYRTEHFKHTKYKTQNIFFLLQLRLIEYISDLTQATPIEEKRLKYLKSVVSKYHQISRPSII